MQRWRSNAAWAYGRNIVSVTVSAVQTGSSNAQLGHALVAEAVADMAQEEMALGFGQRERLIVFFGKVAVSVDIAVVESQIQEGFVGIVCGGEQHFRLEREPRQASGPGHSGSRPQGHTCNQ